MPKPEKKHLKLKATLIPNSDKAKLEVVEMSGVFGSTEEEHAWSLSSNYKTFLANKVRLYYIDEAYLWPVDVEDPYYDSASSRKQYVTKVRIGKVGTSCTFEARLWPKIRKAVEEYNRYGEAEYAKFTGETNAN